MKWRYAALSLCGFALLCGAGTAAETPPAGTGAVAQPASKRPADPLKRTVTLTLSSVNMAELAGEIGEQAELPLSVAPSIREVKATLRLRERPAREVFNGLQELFGFRLTYQKSAKRYLLGPGTYDEQRRLKKERYEEEFRHRIELLQARLAQEPTLGHPVNFPLRLFAQLRSESIEQLWTKRADLTLAHYAELHEEEKDIIRSRFIGRLIGHPDEGMPPRPVTEEDLQKVTVLLRVSGDGPHTRIDYLFTLPGGSGPVSTLLHSRNDIKERLEQKIRLADDSNGSAARIHPLELDEAVSNPFFFTMDSSAAPRDHPSLKKPVSIAWPRFDEYVYKGEFGKPLTKTDYLFQRLAKQANIDLITDAYAQPPQGFFKDIRNQPLGEAFRLLREQLGYRWSQRHGIHLLRLENWDAAEDADLPAPKTRRWIRYWNQRWALTDQPLRFDEITTYAADFNAGQMLQLRRFIPFSERLTYAAGAFTLFRALPEPDKRKLLSEEGLPLHQLDLKLRSSVIEKGPRESRHTMKGLFEQPEARLRIVMPDENVLRIEVFVKDRWARLQDIQRSVAWRN